MGWKYIWDVIRWSEIANEIFKVKSEGRRVKNEERRMKNTRQVIHGISMGAATTMAVSGEKTPDYVKCLVEDCGYTRGWDEFAAQLRDQVGSPGFAVMNTTSAVWQHGYGWSFAEAQQIEQVRTSTKPMLFINGDKDAFVPQAMVPPI